MSNKASVTIIGAGLAGAEAAWQVAKAGLNVELYEMRPAKSTPAHHTDNFAELVCSNSFGALSTDRSSGLLKEELRLLNSFVIKTADTFSVPAGGALAVDRSEFSSYITKKVSEHPLIKVIREEIKNLPQKNQVSIIATGPLTSNHLGEDLKKFTGREECHFFDAASPIIKGDSIDFSLSFKASRYDKGEADYVNCPMSKEHYLAFWNELITAEQCELKDFDKQSAQFFEGCLPIEELARRGEETMRYGPLKPIGLWDPRWGDFKNKELRLKKRAYAVVQLRKEDKAGKLWNLVGFQTNLKWSEQKRIIKMIPGLQNAEFVRFGVMHRNTFIESPNLLEPTLEFINNPNFLAAGQITGTEGYAAAVAGGWLAGTNAALKAKGLQPITLPKTTMIGSLINFITGSLINKKDLGNRKFQPMPPNFGLLPELNERIKDKRSRYAAYRDRALNDLNSMKTTHENLIKLTSESSN